MQISFGNADTWFISIMIRCKLVKFPTVGGSVLIRLPRSSSTWSSSSAACCVRACVRACKCVHTRVRVVRARLRVRACACVGWPETKDAPDDVSIILLFRKLRNVFASVRRALRKTVYRTKVSAGNTDKLQYRRSMTVTRPAAEHVTPDL